MIIRYLMPRVSEIFSIKDTLGETFGISWFAIFSIILTCLSSVDEVSDLDYAVSLEEAG